jgi:hypothetical protein
MAYSPISNLPTPPSRQDPANFSGDADSFLGALPTFQTEVNAAGDYVDSKVAEVDADAAAAAASVVAAQAAADSSVAAANATAWVSGASYTEGYAVWSLVNYQTYRAITDHSGETGDPSADATNWAVLGSPAEFVQDPNGVITVSGSNVGIGTISPAKTLDINTASATFRVRNSSTGNDFSFKTTTGPVSVVGSEANASLGFMTNNTERMRIDTSGKVLVNRTAAYSDGVVGSPALQVNAVTGGFAGLGVIATATTSTAAVGFVNPNGSIGNINLSGSTTTYNTASDYRLKENITSIEGAADIVKAMNPCTYNFKGDSADWHDGFLAHELQELHPRAVVGEKDEMYDEEYEVVPAVLGDDGEEITEAVLGTRSVPKYQSVDYAKLTPILTAALKEALTKIDDLETRLSAMEAAS